MSEDSPDFDFELRRLLQAGAQVTKLPFHPFTHVDVTAGALSLEYKGDFFSVDSARHLRRAFSTDGLVKRLKLSGVPLRMCKVLLEDLEESSSLEELEFFHVGCAPDEEFTVKLSGIFGNLRVLRLLCSDIGDHFAMDIAFFLQDNTRLEELCLSYSNITDDGASSLAEALAVNCTLRKLVLAYNNLTSRTLLAFAETLNVNTTLEMVDLFEVEMVPEEVENLFQEEKYADIFKRIYVLWQDDFLPHLTRLLQEDRHCAEVSVEFTNSVPEEQLRDFFEAVATNATVRRLCVNANGKSTFEALADGLVSVLQRTTALTRLENLMPVDEADDTFLIRVLDALRDNRSVTTFTMCTERMTSGIAASLSALLATNDVLNDVSVCDDQEISSEDLAVIAEGLRNNYTVTDLTLGDALDYELGLGEVTDLLDRNRDLLYAAVEFARPGGGDVEGIDALGALKKVRSSAALVETLQKITGKNKDAVMADVEAALARA